MLTIVIDQSSESVRLHGPHAVRVAAAGTLTLEPAPADRGAWDPADPPPSSNGPTALRGEALVQALAGLR